MTIRPATAKRIEAARRYSAYVGAGSPPVEGWNLEGGDGHDVKLAYSCWREWQCYGDERYRRAASARVSAAMRETVAP